MREGVGVVVIPVTRDRRVLMLPGNFENEGKRESGISGELKSVHGYEFMGGGVDEGESLEEAVCREVCEEGGLILDLGRLSRLPEIYRVNQVRGDELVAFSVVCFILRMSEGDESCLREMGASGLADISVIRPRDEMLISELEGVLWTS